MMKNFACLGTYSSFLTITRTTVQWSGSTAASSKNCHGQNETLHTAENTQFNPCRDERKKEGKKENK